MSKQRKDLTSEQVRDFFSYDHETGVLKWKNCRAAYRNGDVVGYAGRDGHLVVHLLGKHYYVHRIVWLYHYGTWPVDLIDHINRDPSDNRIANLREASHQLNSINKRARGYYKTKLGKYCAQIMRNRRSVFLGHYADEASARAAYLRAREEMGVV